MFGLALLYAAYLSLFSLGFFTIQWSIYNFFLKLRFICTAYSTIVIHSVSVIKFTNFFIVDFYCYLNWGEKSQASQLNSFVLISSNKISFWKVNTDTLSGRKIFIQNGDEKIFTLNPSAKYKVRKLAPL